MEFVAGSPSCSEGFSEPGSQFLPTPQKTFQHFQFPMWSVNSECMKSHKNCRLQIPLYSILFCCSCSMLNSKNERGITYFKSRLVYSYQQHQIIKQRKRYKIQGSSHCATNCFILFSQSQHHTALWAVAMAICLGTPSLYSQCVSQMRSGKAVMSVAASSL